MRLGHRTGWQLGFALGALSGCSAPASSPGVDRTSANLLAQGAATSEGLLGLPADTDQDEPRDQSPCLQPPRDCASAAGSRSGLAAFACRAGLRMGSAVDYPQLTSEAAYIDVVSRELDYVTSGNTMKWGVVQPADPEHWDFTQADGVVAFARAHHQAIKGHTLVWHNQLPPFVDANTPPDLLRKYLRRNIREVVGRYRGRLYAWDVVNEAIADNGGGLRDTVFSQKLGSDYVAWAFREAHAVDPRARLFYNEYGTETVNPKSDAVLAMVTGLLTAGVPIDGVGFQMHLDAATAPSTEDMVTNLERFTALGLSVNISELDVKVASLPSTEPEKLALQKQVFHRVVAACLQVPGCGAVTTWGFTDKYSWLAPDEALWLDTEYGRKPAYYGLVDGFAGIAPDPTGSAPNLIANASFESGLDGWLASGGTLSSPGTQRRSHSGSGSALVGDRALSSDGLTVDITRLATPGHGYDVSAWARLAGRVAADQVTVTASISCPNVPDVVLGLGTVTAGKSAWTQILGSLQVPSCQLTSAVLIVGGPQPGVDLLVDDVALRPQPEPRGPNIVANPGFESGDTSGWVTWGAAIAVTTASAHGGTSSAVVSDRTATWQGPVLPLTAAVTPGATYAAGAWVRIDGAPSSAVSLTMKSTCNGGDSYQQIAGAVATSAGWVQLSGTFVVPVCLVTELDIYVEGPAPGISVLVDDVAVERLLWHPLATSVLTSSDFESGGTGGWGAFGGSFSVSTAFAHGGMRSGEGSDRTATWNGPSYSLPPSPATYSVSAWALQDGTDPLSLQLTGKLVCGDTTNYVWVAGVANAPPTTWVQLQGQLAVPAGCGSVMLYLEQSGGVSFPNLYVDDVAFTLTP